MLHTGQKEKQERICSNPKCKELGVYPAPKSRDQLREYLYFCINCIRDFNNFLILITFDFCFFNI